MMLYIYPKVFYSCLCYSSTLCYSLKMKSVYISRGEICQCRHCQRQWKFFTSGVNFSIFTHFFVCFFPLKLLKLVEIDSVQILAWKSGGVKFWQISYLYISCPCISACPWLRLWPQLNYLFDIRLLEPKALGVCFLLSNMEWIQCTFVFISLILILIWNILCI